MFPIKQVYNRTKTFLNKIFFAYSCRIDCWEKKLFITLPYLCNLSLSIRTRLQNSVNKNLSFCKIKVIFKSTAHLSKFFHFKDKVLFNLRSNVVYKFSCGRCNAAYYGKTCWHLNIKVGEHSGVSPLTRTKLKAIKQLLFKIICSFAIM